MNFLYALIALALGVMLSFTATALDTHDSAPSDGVAAAIDFGVPVVDCQTTVVYFDTVAHTPHNKCVDTSANANQHVFPNHNESLSYTGLEQPQSHNMIEPYTAGLHRTRVMWPNSVAHTGNLYTMEHANKREWVRILTRSCIPQTIYI